MKLTCALLIASTMGVYATGNAQTMRVNIQANNVSTSKVLSEIEKQTDYLFIYDKNEVDLKRKTSVNASNTTTAEVLSDIFDGTDIIYAIEGENIMLMRRNNYNRNQQVEVRQKIVTGKVFDEEGNPIVGANVVVERTSKGTVTDIEGNFSINAPEGSSLRISYVGFKDYTIKIGNKKTLSITLKENTEMLDELVVVGYGSVKKRDLTGAVSSVKGEDIVKMTEPSIGTMLQGKAAGLQVSQNSAQPGGGLSFLIRGAGSVNASNSPLIVVDGFPITEHGEPGGGLYDGGQKSSLNTLNPNDIESIEVLKDASSTAIYGARASNGVILITTKQGKSKKPVVEYSGNVAVQQFTDTYDVLNASEMMYQINRTKKELWMRDNLIAPYGNKTESEISATNPFIPQYSNEEINHPTANTNWLNEVMRTGIITQHNVSISKGGDGTKYMVSGNYYNQKGVVKESGIERFSGRVNLEQKINDYVTVGIITSASKVKNSSVPLGGLGSFGVIRTSIQASPIVNVRDENGDYALNPTISSMPNPVSLLEIEDKSSVENIRAIGSITVTPLEGLSVKFNAGIDRNIGSRTIYVPKTTLTGRDVGGRADINHNNRTDTNFDLTATYNKTFNKSHSLSAVVGGSYQTFYVWWNNSGNQDFLIDKFKWYNLGSGNFPRPWVASGGSKDAMASFFGRVNYNLMDRYLFTATLRADGASNFAKNKKWGYFPSVAFAWKVMNESFMEGTKDILSDLKLRISYGQTGNASIGSRALALYGAGSQICWDENQHIGTYQYQLGNPDLSWEKSTEVNVGVDFGLLNQRISGSVEYFNRVTSDLLAWKSLMSYLPINGVNANIGATRSTGWEVTLNSHNIVSKDFNWNTTFTFSRYVDRWKERNPEWKPAIYEKDNDYIRPIFSYISDGLIQAGEEVPHMPGALPGQIKFKDLGGYKMNEDGSYATDENGRFINTNQPDGKLDDADKICLGNSSPGFNMGLNNTLQYKNFDLNIYFYGAFNRTMINPLIEDYSMRFQDIVNGRNYPSAWVTNMWTHDNQEGTYPSMFTNPFGSANYFREKAWYIRCKNISLGYTINKWIRVSANVDNVFVITPYSGSDPETDTYAASYPNARTYSIGVNLNF